MRLPKIRQLTEDQKKVYLYAPTDQHVLVQGPPGTGKTLIACLRAIELQKRQVPVMLGMFNRVLAKYSSNAGDGQIMPSRTVLQWFHDWWGKACIPPHPSMSGKILIEVPFEEKEAAKAAGASWQRDVWRPWGKGYGAWTVDPTDYFGNSEKFCKWKLWHKPPVVHGDQLRLDWKEIAIFLLEHEELIPDSSLNLGTLLIDEGQDFPPGFYKTLYVLSAFGATRGKERVPHPPKCFVLADENQQITEENSTLNEIADTLRVSPDHRYVLLDNFRNSKEIAELARSFFDDVGVLPRIPLRSSSKPSYAVMRGHPEVVEKIRIWMTNNPQKEVGVFVYNDLAREGLVTALENSLSRINGRSVTVQTYSWKSRELNPVSNLQFDKADVVTVLNMQSCKGLEFDAVFIVDLHQAQLGLNGPSRFKMQMFVAVSRARDFVNLLDSGRQAGQGQYFQHLPSSDYLDREQNGRQGSIVPRAGNLVSAKNIPEQSSPMLEACKDESSSDWEATLASLCRKIGLTCEDKRSKGGALWVKGGMEFEKHLRPLGFAYAASRTAWWRK
jgi:DNA helicase-2/ATP-dependent DNA helicase PcrA